MTEIKNQGIHKVFYMDRQGPFYFQKSCQGKCKIIDRKRGEWK